LECVVRPDVELKQIMDAVSKICEYGGSKVVNSDENTDILASHNKKGNLRYSILQRSHAIISRFSKNGLLKPVEKEWDIIDVQVCISKDLRQRVLLCQFLKKLSNNFLAESSSISNSVLNGAIFQTMIGSISVPIVHLNSYPKTKKFISLLKVCEYFFIIFFFILILFY
jgi:hypothetical protein